MTIKAVLARMTAAPDEISTPMLFDRCSLVRERISIRDLWIDDTTQLRIQLAYHFGVFVITGQVSPLLWILDQIEKLDPRLDEILSIEISSPNTAHVRVRCAYLPKR